MLKTICKMFVWALSAGFVFAILINVPVLGIFLLLPFMMLPFDIIPRHFEQSGQYVQIGFASVTLTSIEAWLFYIALLTVPSFVIMCATLVVGRIIQLKRSS